MHWYAGYYNSDLKEEKNPQNNQNINISSVNLSSGIPWYLFILDNRNQLWCYYEMNIVSGHESAL